MSEETNLEIQGSGLQCDNPDCKWSDNTITEDTYKDWLNRPCPKCGQNILTEEDYANAETIRLAAKFINTLSKEELQKLTESIGDKEMDELKNNPIFSGAKGLDNLKKDENLTMIISTHKKIKVEEIKKSEQ